MKVKVFKAAIKNENSNILQNSDSFWRSVESYHFVKNE